MATSSEVRGSNAPRFLIAEWRAWIAAVTFLTRIPAYRFAAHDAADLPASSVYFPLVGAVVAAIGTLAYVAANALWPIPLAVIVSVAATVWATGAFHEDAAADSFDGFGGGWSREQILTIMKDSRVGSYALVGVVLLLAAKIAALCTIATNAGPAPLALTGGVPRALLAGHVLGRWSSLPLIWRHPYVRAGEEGRASAGKPFVGGVTLGRLAVATILTALMVIAAAGSRAPIVIAAALVVMVAGGRYARRRIGGITGDVLGAVNQFVELATYLALAARPLSIA
jgi:adenosylcobinamide-GDP ribazoletransferase